MPFGSLIPSKQESRGMAKSHYARPHSRALASDHWQEVRCSAMGSDEPTAPVTADVEGGELAASEIVPAGLGELAPVAAIESRLEVCPCGHRLGRGPGSVHVADIARGNAGWIAQGRYSSDV